MLTITAAGRRGPGLKQGQGFRFVGFEQLKQWLNLGRVGLAGAVVGDLQGVTHYGEAVTDAAQFLNGGGGGHMHTSQ
jgi:hypothetical protein